MRILIVSEDVPYPSMGGLAKHALNLARALVQAGHQVDFLGGKAHAIEVAGDEGQFGGRFFGELDGQDIGWKEVGLGMFLPPRRTWLARRFARVIMRRAPDYDVIHYHGHVPNVARFIPAHVNFVQTRHDQGSDCLINTRFRNGDVCTSTDPRDCARCRAPAPNLLQRASSVAAVKRYRTEVAEGFVRHKTVFVSDMLKKNFARTMGQQPIWGITIHNFIDTRRVAQARAAAARQAPHPHNETHVFVAGKLYREKGIEPFLREAAKRLPPTMHITVAGDGPDEARLRAELGSGQIHFLGWCTSEETLRRAAQADAIVVPSIWEEPCASTVFEGLLLGKPTFALARGGTPELAIYGAPHQLRLHDTMQSLVEDLVSFDARVTYPPVREGLGGPDDIVRQLLSIYRLPPGRSLSDDSRVNSNQLFKRRSYVD